MLKYAAIAVVVCELIAFASWVVNYTRIKELKYKLFAFYLGIIAIIELLNLLYDLPTAWPNMLVLYVNVPLQFCFLFYFLLYKRGGKKAILPVVFMCVYLFFFLTERYHFFTLPVNFDSLSYGIGNLLLIAAIVILLADIFRNNDPVVYNKTPLFWILIGLIIFYIGSFPYHNFRNFFWSQKSYYQTAYFLHYTSQVFNCMMYLLFAYAVKWKIK
jgi:hypothetical protein